MNKNGRAQVRKFSKADLAMVKSLIDRTIDHCYSGIYRPEAIRFFKDWHDNGKILKNTKEGYTLVVEKDGRIIGTGTIVEDEIVRVFVDPAYQKLGFGKLLMQKLEEKALANSVEVVKLDASIPSKKFYDSLGYATLEKTFRELDDDQRLDYYKMEKSLIRKQ
jgi:GNAT superfamily N-acetyltransferase